MVRLLLREIQRFAGSLILIVPFFATAGLLVGGTDLLVMLGLARQTAGAITVAFTIAAILACMYLFATRVIEW